VSHEISPPPRHVLMMPTIPRIEPQPIHTIVPLLDDTAGQEWNENVTRCAHYWNSHVENGRATVRPGSQHAVRPTDEPRDADGEVESRGR
jgi:hypothetical protein